MLQRKQVEMFLLTFIACFAESSIEGRMASARTFISSRPIKLSELKEVNDRLHRNKDTGFIQEFKVMPL